MEKFKISNEVFNMELSLEAIGLLSYFLSLPVGNKITKTTLHESLGIGREKTHRIFKELQNSGCIKTEKLHDEFGRITYQYTILNKLIIS